MRLYSMLALPLFLIICAAIGTPVMAGPVAEFEPMSFDIGKPMEGEKAKAVFQVKNTGDTYVEITSVRAGCGCTAAKASETIIQPGKTASIEAIFNTTGYPGEIFKTVTVTTNDPTHATVVLKITGEVIPIAEIKPEQYLNLGDIKPGAIILSDFVIVPKIKQQYKLTKVNSSGKRVMALAFDRRRNKSGNYLLKTRFMAGNTLGRFYEQISIMTDLPTNPIIKCTIYGNVVNDAVAQSNKTQ